MKQKTGYRMVIALVTSLLTPFSMSAEAKESPVGHEFLTLLEHEYNNRVFAHISTSNAAAQHNGKPLGEFYQAYAELEELNQRVYDAMARSMGYDYSAGCWTRTRGQATGILAGMIELRPRLLVRMVEKYLPQLKEMQRLGDERHQPFFSYVIAQEIAQLEAAKAAESQSWRAGATVFREFVAANEGVLQSLQKEIGQI